ncbi:MAG: hypothetical protein OHK0052_24200 [Anaerolineales bacterium]
MSDHPPTILVVDDNETNRALLTRRLERERYRTETAENGQIALDLLRRQPFDLVLLDIMMPVMNGYEVLEHMRTDETLRHIPVIVISALDERESVARCIELGADDHLAKPFDQIILKARIGSSLERKRLYDQQQAHMRELLAMQQIDRELNTSLDVAHVLQLALRWARDYTKATAATACLVSEQTLEIVLQDGYPQQDSTPKNLLLTIGETLPKEILTQPEGRAWNPKETSSLLGFGWLPGAMRRFFLPIRRDDRPIAGLLLESLAPTAFPQEAQNFLQRLSDHAAIALANAQLYAAVQSANQAKSDFVSLVSHELKVPMTSIRGYADLVLKGVAGPVNEMQQKFLQTVLNNVDRMTTLVTDLADVSRIEAGRLRLEPKALSLPDIIQDVVASAKAQIEQKELTLHILLADNLPQIWADTTRLAQVLTNLVSNAYKYTPNGGKIWLEASLPPQYPRHVQIAVRDSGIGIAPEEQNKIFQKFFRSGDDLARSAPGTGLGLNITKYLVEMQGGTIWFESVHREGTTFFFTVPIVES